MRRALPLTLLLLTTTASLAHAGGPVLDAMDSLKFRLPKEKGKAELVEGRTGKAVRFAFDKDARSVFFISPLRGTPEWDRAAGFSFWVKGDGADGFGGLQFIYDEDYAVRYDVAFPFKGGEWTQVTVAWRDLIPVLPGPKAMPLDPQGDNRPSKLAGPWVGKWWYWGDYPATAFAIDELRLEPVIERDTADYAPKGPPLARVLTKLKAGQPVTVVTMGDSLTDFRHWANRKVSWPTLLRDVLRDKYKAAVTVVNPAIGGTQLRQNLVLMPRWLEATPAPDLVTVCFGFNDWDAGMRGEQFEAVCADAVERIRRATKGRADVLLVTTNPAVTRWETMAELADACRKAARRTNAGLADTERAFHATGRENRERLFVWDRTHLGPDGHDLVARTVLRALESGGRE